MRSLQRISILFSLVTFCLSLLMSGQSAPRLTMSSPDDFFFLGAEDVISFQLDSDDLEAVWMLQSSPNGEDWEDLVFLNGGGGVVGFGVSFERRAISGQGFDKMLFRATKRVAEDETYRDYLDGLLRWREKGYGDYTFVVRSGQGLTSYEARYTVVDGEVIGMEKLSSFPDIFDPPSELTIEDLFSQVGSAIEQDAANIDVDWNSSNGYPDRGFIDFALDLADEEQSWTILEFVPKSPESAEFLAARQLWRDREPSNYSFVAETFTRFGALEVRHTVVNGEATMAEVLVQPTFPIDDPEPKTMEDYFNRLAQAFEVGAVDVSVVYDETKGYPVRAGIDFEAFIADEEEFWNVKDLLEP